MRGWRLSLALGCLLAAPGAARTPAYYDCGRGKLDLACRPSPAPRWTVERVDARRADKAYVVRFGGPGREEGEPGWVLQLGNAARQALFWAAVVTTFLL